MDLDTDTDVHGEAGLEMDIGSVKPLGHHVFPARVFALVSQAFNCQGFFDCEEDALPVMRMKARSALKGLSRFDFRLYRWDREQLVWFVARRSVSLGEVAHA